MRNDKCLFCNSRNCHTRIVTVEDTTYDEIACYKHVEDLEVHSDEILGTKNGVLRMHISSTGKLKRGEKFD